MAACSDMNPMYRNSSTSSDVSRASQTHHAPQVGRPQKAPVHSAMKFISAPDGASAVASIADSRALKISPTAAQNAIARYTTIDIHAAGT